MKQICLFCKKELVGKCNKRKYCTASCQLKYEYANGIRDRVKIGEKARAVSHAKQKEHNWLNDKSSRDKLKATQQTEEYKEKQRIAKTGSKNGMWHKTPPNKQFPTKKYWEEKTFKILRQKCFERDNHKCVRCGATNIFCDHIIPYRVCKEHKLDNLQALCASCHAFKNHEDRKNHPEFYKKIRKSI